MGIVQEVGLINVCNLQKRLDTKFFFCKLFEIEKFKCEIKNILTSELN